MYYKTGINLNSLVTKKHISSTASLRHFHAQCRNKVWGPTCS